MLCTPFLNARYECDIDKTLGECDLSIYEGCWHVSAFSLCKCLAGLHIIDLSKFGPLNRVKCGIKHDIIIRS
jgi:hypothetical protein